jgi:hypothetical protein
MNRGDGALPGIRKQYGNAIRGLDRQQYARLAGDQGVALQRLFALRDFRAAHLVHDVGMNLAQSNDAHGAGAKSCEEFRAILQHTLARIPVRESQVEYVFRRTVFPRLGSIAILGKYACAARSGAKSVDEPAEAGESRRSQDLQGAAGA